MSVNPSSAPRFMGNSLSLVNFIEFTFEIKISSGTLTVLSPLENA